ncbi:hypothetical protein X777_12494 [Ooceraea biroi]|uniref:Uncharacterized protein n=1 Tax=Ooceraea biroi TaxID=2015173 RepID=A0A026W011_OOCBI|nr:hypothetical protein X777_12494 [Ooceraea biroi]
MYKTIVRTTFLVIIVKPLLEMGNPYDAAIGCFDAARPLEEEKSNGQKKDKHEEGEIQDEATNKENRSQNEQEQIAVNEQQQQHEELTKIHESGLFKKDLHDYQSMKLCEDKADHAAAGVDEDEDEADHAGASVDEDEAEVEEI